MLLVEAGINIIETMRLYELLDAGVSEFLFVLAPLRIVGATGCPGPPARPRACQVRADV